MCDEIRNGIDDGRAPQSPNTTQTGPENEFDGICRDLSCLFLLTFRRVDHEHYVPKRNGD
jgi:hypothetical protein